MHHCSWHMRELKMLQWQKILWKCVSCGVQFTKNIPNYALGCPLIVECFHPVLGVKVSLCTIFLGRPVCMYLLRQSHTIPQENAGNTWVEQKAARTTKFSQPNLFLSNTMLVLNKASLLLNVLSIVWRNLGENCMSAHAFLAFLGLLIFWIGMFKVSRWNGLEILNPKHMWKSQIRLLEQK